MSNLNCNLDLKISKRWSIEKGLRDLIIRKNF